MSLDIFLFAFKNGDEHFFDRAIVERAFEGLICDEDKDGFGIQLPDWGVTSAYVFIQNTPQIAGFSIERPPSDPVFFKALFEVMRQTPMILIRPGPGSGCTNCTASADLIPQLPSGVIHEGDRLVIVSSGEDLDAAVYPVD